ncbi:DUF2563 family protein [Mycolicibacter sinensis]|uniref:DUF2563 domain-containing protein n=1 Tax=Mycolicibacter sinensis (strain JDM601) TaxID=875328 RepID=A0A1A3U1E8_MYCSD|nr:DUF2563 family protein [Mycolicibacter sinensis]OBK88527.1 hypothetical protein A5648_01680 [Mycolicibacter sinensis]
MFVDPAMPRSGAVDARDASEHAHAGAARLNQTAVASNIFGGLGAADVFRNAISAAHTEHITTLTVHRRTLAEVGDKAHHAAREFTGMDQHNAAQLRAVRCNSST